MSETSTKPYMIRALYEWCCDNGYTPYVAVAVDRNTRVPRQHVKAGEIVLNVSPMATNRLRLGNDLIEFQARFSGVAHEISVPIDNVSAIYARETGHGMAFEVPKPPAIAGRNGAADGDDGPGVDSAVPDGDGAQDAARPAGPRDVTGDRRAPAARAPRRRGPRAVDGSGGEAATVTALPTRAASGDGLAGGAEVIAFSTSGASRRKKAESEKAAAEKAAVEKAAADKVIADRTAADRAADGSPATRTAAGEEAAGEPEAAADGSAAGAEPPQGEDPPPSEGGGKGRKARLTRVK